MDAPAAEFDEEQHIPSLEPHGIDGEEIHRDDAVGLGTEEEQQLQDALNRDVPRRTVPRHLRQHDQKPAILCGSN